MTAIYRWLPGSYLSTVSRPVVPSNPPTAYSIPLSTATPSVLRRESMGVSRIHLPSSRSSLSTVLEG